MHGAVFFKSLVHSSQKREIIYKRVYKSNFSDILFSIVNKENYE